MSKTNLKKIFLSIKVGSENKEMAQLNPPPNTIKDYYPNTIRVNEQDK